MIAINVPPQVRFVSDRIKGLYEDVSYRALCSIVAYFLLGKPSLSQLVRDCPFTMSCSALGRAVKLFPPNRLMRRIKASLLRKIEKNKDDKDRYAFVIDDSDNPRYGKGFTGVGKWGCSKGVYDGQKIVCLVVTDTVTKKSYPVGYRFANKDSDSTALDLAVELVAEAINAGLPCFPVVTDSWFSSTSLISKMESLGCEYIGEIKSNRLVKSSPNPRGEWLNLQETLGQIPKIKVLTPWDNPKIRARRKTRKSMSSLVVMIKKRKTPLRVVAMFNRRNSKKAFSYYVSTDRTSSGARIWMMSRVRWSIECVFRSCKQSLSFGDLSCTGDSASHLAVEMPLYLYSLIQMEPDKFLIDSGDSVDRGLAKIREQSFGNSLRLILGGQKPLAVERLRNRHSRARAHRKPCNKAAA